MRIFVLTGAGLSAESGLGKFRDAPDALWRRYRPEELATPEAFARDPALVHDFYDMRRRVLLGAEPNEAQRALVRLRAGLHARGGALVLCTQNVEDLHERAGSTDVIHMHGQLLEARCTRCRAVSDWRGDMGMGAACPACGAVGWLRPNVIWFGEMPMHMARITEALGQADLFVAIGTSGSVYPAAGFVGDARDVGITTCEINLEPSDNARMFDDRRYGPATQTVPTWVSGILGESGGI